MYNLALEENNQIILKESEKNILKLHSDFEDEYKTAPASGRPNYHNCFKGGYLDHVLHVIKNSVMIKKLYEKNGVKSIHSDSVFNFLCVILH